MCGHRRRPRRRRRPRLICEGITNGSRTAHSTLLASLCFRRHYSSAHGSVYGKKRRTGGTASNGAKAFSIVSAALYNRLDPADSIAHPFPAVLRPDGPVHRLHLFRLYPIASCSPLRFRPIRRPPLFAILIFLDQALQRFPPSRAERICRFGRQRPHASYLHSGSQPSHSGVSTQRSSAQDYADPQRVTSTTVNLVLTVRKAASLAISVWYYGSGITPGLVIGGLMVLGENLSLP